MNVTTNTPAKARLDSLAPGDCYKYTGDSDVGEIYMRGKMSCSWKGEFPPPGSLPVITLSSGAVHFELPDTMVIKVPTVTLSA